MPPIGSWTPERVEKLRTLWREGQSASQIAKALGEPLLSRNSVIGKVHRLKLPLRVNPTLSNKPPKKFKKNAKRVTLPPLPINRPDMVADTRLLKSAAFTPLPISVPKRLVDLGPVGTKDRLGECRWPVGENPTLFCACATYETYCPTHAARAHRPTEKKNAKVA